jgi:hypothetical protein
MSMARLITFRGRTSDRADQKTNLARSHILNRRGCVRETGYMPLALAETSNP